MKLLPAYLTKDQFVAVLNEIKTLAEDDDSFEGTLSYEMPWSQENGDPATDPSSNGFRVCARYRTGNSMGQGGMRIIGEWIE